MYQDVEQLLLTHGIKYQKKGNVIKCLCPNPSHNDRHIGSFSFDTIKGVGHCFSCGILIYLAVELYKKTKSFIPVIMCVMAFILSGAEHSIADAFYLGASQLSLVAFGKLGLIILGNAAGSLITRWLQRKAEYLNELPNNIQR